MAGLIYDFIKTLETESELYSQLIEVGNIKRSHIIKGNLKEMGDANTVEGHLITKLKKVEKERAGLMSDIATVLNLNAEDVTITQIENALKNQPEEALSLGKVKVKLRDAMAELKVINDENIVLINHSLEYAEFSINMMQSSQGAPITADYGVATNKKRGTSLFDAKQ